MIKFELFIPIYANPFNNRIKKALKGFLSGLLLDLDINQIIVNNLSSDRRFVEVIIEGNDELVAYRFLQREIGTKRTDIKENEEVIGRLYDNTEDAFLLDLGFEKLKLFKLSPEDILSYVVGRNITKIVSTEFVSALFGLKKFFPFFVKVKEDGTLILAEKSINFFRWMVKSPFDFIIAYGVTRNSLESSIRKLRLKKFIKNVHRINFLEQLIIMRDNQRTNYVVKILSEGFPKAVFAKIIKKRLKRHLELLFL